METGPDGERYYELEYGTGLGFTKNADAGLARIDYIRYRAPRVGKNLQVIETSANSHSLLQSYGRARPGKCSLTLIPGPWPMRIHEVDE